jgi:hypothetical protein
MGTDFLLVDEANGRYFDLEGNTPFVSEEDLTEVFLDMVGNGPRCERTWEGVKQLNFGYEVAEKTLRSLFDFLERAQWRVKLAADCWTRTLTTSSF